MESHLNQLFDYNFYCNKELILQAKDVVDYPESCKRLFSHILNVHHLWNAAILGEASEYTQWQIHAIEDWEDIHYNNQRTTFELLRNTEDLSKRINYTTEKGNTYTTEYKDVLFHIINHSTHHRGQLLVELRKHNVEPLELDYIIYKR
ncbi:DinB family protein [Croceivirga sp. JEA036]|uniref:DinB family protein n=1 Tax=Croceivirga sp. JEA036 TaxID=2721162 RepID=UPI001439B8EA|nr:DinB family protein [Croceivirga sp. JEA036]NJB36580.1 damage-inducible protein DinB [Croceivirga sp. JEA036]